MQNEKRISYTTAPRETNSQLPTSHKLHCFSASREICGLNFGRLTFGSEPRRRWFKCSRADPLFSCSCSHFQIARRFEFPSIPSNNEDFGRNATFDLKTKVVSLSWPTQFGLSPPTGSWIVAQTEPRRAGGQPSCRFLLAFEARLAYLEEIPATEVSDGSTCTQGTIPGNRLDQ